ncbi:MAG: hypothetical protein ACYDB4_13510 [Candidatus Dormibacteraceae bacterium]
MHTHDRLIWERTIKPLVNQQLIDEHRQRPFGHHSLALARVLDFLRRDANIDAPRYVSLATVPGRDWRIGVHSRKRGEPLKVLNDQIFNSEEEVEHAIFLRRLEDWGFQLGRSDGR